MSNKPYTPKCPACNNELTEEEVKDYTCWICHEDLKPTTNALLFNCCCGNSHTKLNTQVPLIDGYYLSTCIKCDAKISLKAGVIT